MSIQYTTDQLQRKFPGAPGSPGFARLAEGFRSEGRLDEAIQVCQDGLKARPLQLSGYLVFGKTLIDAGRLEEAREQFESALRLDARCLSAMHFLAQIMNKLQWGEAAAGYYRSILEVEPWDADIRALLGQPPLPARNPSSMPSAPASFEPTPPQDFSPVDPHEDTFHKPEGFAGDVMEINLNDGADIPASQDPGANATVLEEDDLSLEDALAMQPAASIQAVPELRMEPVPGETPGIAPAVSEPAADEPVPISGQDVEDRLDSLFGTDDAMPDSAPAVLSQPAFLGDATTIQSGAERLPEVSEPAFDPDATLIEAQDRVSGEDIEKRLDDLFSLTAEDRFPGSDPAATDAFALSGTATMPAAIPSPDPEVSPADPDVPPTEPEALVTGAEIAAEPLAEAAAVDEDMVTGQDVAEKLDRLFGADPVTEERAAEQADAFEQGRKTGVFDSNWSPAAPEAPPSPEAKGGMASATGTASASDMESASATTSEPRESELTPAPEAAKPEPWDLDMESGHPPVGEIMSTESLLPMGWLADAGDQPRITGADIEAQLDKLFDMEGESDRFDAAKVVPGNLQVPVTFADLDPSRPMDAAPEAKPQPMPGDESDLTVTMPVMRDSGLKESVSDWLARQSDQDPETDDSGELRLLTGSDTMFMPSEDAQSQSGSGNPPDADFIPDFDATLASEDMGPLAETASIEMIDGTDVAERLDELFAPEGSGIETTGMEMPPAETGTLSANALETSDSEAMVTGEEVASRLSEIFEAPEVPFNLETGLETDLEGGDEGMPAPEAASKEAAGQSSTGSSQSSNALAPMMDEEDGYPEEEEMSPQDAAGANVATVTLAEIYFQQGLKEQSLQIYRQLLEREPGNDSVRKRITEIEASKPEGENQDPDGQKPKEDPRRPRPGLKVPKRKK